MQIALTIAILSNIALWILFSTYAEEITKLKVKLEEQRYMDAMMLNSVRKKWAEETKQKER